MPRVLSQFQTLVSRMLKLILPYWSSTSLFHPPSPYHTSTSCSRLPTHLPTHLPILQPHQSVIYPPPAHLHSYLPIYNTPVNPSICPSISIPSTIPPSTHSSIEHTPTPLLHLLSHRFSHSLTHNHHHPQPALHPFNFYGPMYQSIYL